MSTKSLRFALAMSGLLAFGGAAYAETPWQDNHARRDEIRAHENARIREHRREQELRAERARERQHEQHVQRERHEFVR
jgi:hypothetical protein